MHTVSAGSTCNVSTIVYQQPCFAVASNLSRARDKLIKHADRQRLLAYLKQYDLCLNSSPNEAQCVRNCLRSRLTVRYRIGDWKAEPHLLWIVSQGSSGFAKQ